MTDDKTTKHNRINPFCILQYGIRGIKNEVKTTKKNGNNTRLQYSLIEKVMILRKTNRLANCINEVKTKLIQKTELGLYPIFNA